MAKKKKLTGKPNFKVIKSDDLPEGVSMRVMLPKGWTEEQAKLIEHMLNKDK